MRQVDSKKAVDVRVDDFFVEIMWLDHRVKPVDHFSRDFGHAGTLVVGFS